MDLPEYTEGMRTRRPRQRLDYGLFIEWKTSVLTVLDAVIPRSHIHRDVLATIRGLESTPDSREFAVSFLKSILGDLEEGFLNRVQYAVDAEVNADYLAQAEALVESGQTDKAHIAAAVIAGAVLEHGLRTILDSIETSEPSRTAGSASERRGLNALIDDLKRRGVFNEVRAKELRGFADIRNAAAHGRFGDFTPEQVRRMVSGITDFLARHGPM